MKTLIIYFFLVSIFISLSSCDFSDEKLKVWNNTKDSIAFIIPTLPDNFPTDTALSKSSIDTLLSTRVKYNPSDDSPWEGAHFLAGDSSKNLMVFNTTWEGVIERSHNQKLEIYFFPVSVMTSGNFTWKEIWSRKLYTKKEVLSEDKLEKLGWNIHYED